MVDINNCYFHAIYLDGYGMLKIFDEILDCGKILSFDKSSFSSSDYRMNKSDEICLCKKEKSTLFYDSAYDLYVKTSLSFILKGDLPEVYSPKLIPVLSNNMRYINSGKTDLIGEYRKKDEIDLDDVVGINIPVNGLINDISIYKWFLLGIEDSWRGRLNHNRENRIKNTVLFYDKVVECLDRHDLCIPIYDIETGVEIKEKDDIVKMKRR